MTPMCQAGEVMRFRVDGTAALAKCVNHRLVTTDHTWSVHVARNRIDLVITIDGVSSVLLFDTPENDQTVIEMRLRTQGQTPGNPTEDRIYLYSNP
jgi:hypothetical protein